METKKITLRSQTVKCPHCGEYYSVTYKYCPFCDAGRQEEERRLAEKKKKKQAFFSNLFGGGHEEEKPAKSAKRPAKAKEDASAEPKKLPEDLGEGPDLLAATPRPRPEVALRNERNPRAFDAEGVEIPLEEIKPKAHRERSGQPAHGSKAAHSGKNGKRKKPALEPEQPELTTPHRRRKKTSEMTGGPRRRPEAGARPESPGGRPGRRGQQTGGRGQGSRGTVRPGRGPCSDGAGRHRGDCAGSSPACGPPGDGPACGPADRGNAGRDAAGRLRAGL